MVSAFDFEELCLGNYVLDLQRLVERDNIVRCTVNEEDLERFLLARQDCRKGLECRFQSRDRTENQIVLKQSRVIWERFGVESPQLDGQQILVL